MSPPQRSSAASVSPIHRDYPPSPEYPVVSEGIKHLAIGGDSEKSKFLREEGRRSSHWPTEAEASRKGKELGKKSNASAIRKCSLPMAKIESSSEIDNEAKAIHKTDEEIRPWNLRPRNAKSKEVFGGEMNKAEAQLRRGGKEGKGEDKEKGEKKKKKLSINISLTKEEIEEDIFALTGARPSRRPQKRPKNVQKQLDLTFPGLNLHSITPDSY